MDQTTHFIGLDIGKARIEVFIPGIDESLTIANTRTGLAVLRRQLRKIDHAHVITRLTNQMPHFRDALVRRSAASRLKAIAADLEKIEAGMMATVNASARSKGLFALICSVPGVGPISAITLLANLPELYMA